jgi:hypothetical protein
MEEILVKEFLGAPKKGWTLILSALVTITEYHKLGNLERK